jgi:hypothetical protein
MNKLKDAEELLNAIMVNVFDHTMQQFNCVDILYGFGGETFYTTILGRDSPIVKHYS